MPFPLFALAVIALCASATAAGVHHFPNATNRTINVRPARICRPEHTFCPRLTRQTEYGLDRGPSAVRAVIAHSPRSP